MLLTKGKLIYYNHPLRVGHCDSLQELHEYFILVVNKRVLALNCPNPQPKSISFAFSNHELQ